MKLSKKLSALILAAAFADLNNLEIAKILENFLHEKGLDGRENPHQGPQPKGLTEYTIPLAQ